MRCELVIDVLQLAGRFAEREPGRDDGAGGRAAHQIEPVAEAYFHARSRAEQALNPLQERNRYAAAHAAAIERQHPFLTRREQVPVTRRMIPSHAQSLAIRRLVSTP